MTAKQLAKKILELPIDQQNKKVVYEYMDTGDHPDVLEAEIENVYIFGDTNLLSEH